MSDKLTRRDFLKLSAAAPVVAAGLATIPTAQARLPDWHPERGWIFDGTTYFTGYIRYGVIYDCRLTPPEVAAISQAMVPL